MPFLILGTKVISVAHWYHQLFELRNVNSQEILDEILRHTDLIHSLFLSKKCCMSADMFPLMKPHFVEILLLEFVVCIFILPHILSVSNVANFSSLQLFSVLSECSSDAPLYLMKNIP